MFQVLLRLLADLVELTVLLFRQRQASAAEILVLRRQLALYQERGVKPRRVDPITRVSLAILSWFFNWGDALVVVRPETMIRWHRAGWKLFWRLKSRPGRPPIPREVQALILRMHLENLWEANYQLSGDRNLEKPIAMAFPAIGSQVCGR